MTGRVPSTMRATWIVACKELVASFRDKQTTLYTIVLPLALYPFLFWAMVQGALFVQGRAERQQVRLGVAAESGAEIPPEMAQALHAAPPRGKEPHARPTAEHGSSAAPAAASETAPAPRTIAPVHVTTRPDALDEIGARAWLAESDAQRGTASEDDPVGPPDAVLLLHAPPPGADAPASEARPADLFYDSTKNRSDIARKRVEARLPAFAGRLRDDAATRLGYDPASLAPFVAEEGKDVAAEERGGAFLLSMILPMLLVVMTVIGAFYPAVDFTAGERERNTAETTALLPVPRRAVHQGKILAVCACAVLATTLNLLALGFSAEHLLNMLSRDQEFEVVVPVAALVSIAPLAVLFAFFVSAVLTGIAALARTFKEGQALLGPVQLVFLFPAMAGAMPGLELTPTTALVPVVNVVLAFRALLKGQSLPLEYALTAASLFALAALSVVVALRVLSRESLTASSGRSLGILDFVSLVRSRGASR